MAYLFSVQGRFGGARKSTNLAPSRILQQAGAMW